MGLLSKTHSASAQPTPAPAPPSQMPPPQFPPSFIVYSISLNNHHYILAETEHTPPLYAVSFHAGFHGVTGPDTELHSGPNESAPPLATAKRGHLLGDNASVKLGGPDGGDNLVKEVVNSTHNFPYPKYDFTIEVGKPGEPQQREQFEWQHIGMRKGWQLVRLSTGEVVAVFEWTALTKKDLHFQFVGTGGTGLLGERWAIMAAITAIRAWDQVKRKQATGTVGIPS